MEEKSTFEGKGVKEVANYYLTHTTNNAGITLIALIITIILLIVLSGIAINLSIGENGILRRTQEARLKEEQLLAREKLELALLDLQTLKKADKDYNEKEYINNYLKSKKMNIDEDIVTIDNWKYKIDRKELQIIYKTVKVSKIVKEYLGKNERGKHEAEVTLTVESSKEIKNVVFYELDGTTIEIQPSENTKKIVKDVKIELDEEYKIIINTKDEKREEEIITEKLPSLGILISTPYVGTSSATIKVQYITNEKDVESYKYLLNEEEISTDEKTEYKLEKSLEPETTYKVKVIAKYKDNSTVESNEVTIKTEARTYLYNNGDTCDELTGGWLTNRYCENQNGKFYYSTLPDNGFNGAKTVDKINNLDKYKRIGVNFNDENMAAGNIFISDYPFYYGSWIFRDVWSVLMGSVDSFITESFTCDSNPYYIWFYAPDGGKCLSINSIWLEK